MKPFFSFQYFKVNIICFGLLDSIRESRNFRMSYILTYLLNVDFKPQFHRRKKNTLSDFDWGLSGKYYDYLRTALKFSNSFLYCFLKLLRYSEVSNYVYISGQIMLIICTLILHRSFILHAQYWGLKSF
jgi:hypothetical protein